MTQDFTFRLLNDFQRDFPLCPKPYAVLAQQLGQSEAAVIETLQSLQDDGRVSRIGAVLRPGCFGVSTLVAMAVPVERLQEVALLVNTFPGVNHNYQREHEFNLWFVLTAGDAPALARSLRQIEAQSALPTLSLPMEKAYHIDLGFPLQGGAVRRHNNLPAAPQSLSSEQKAILARVQEGIPLLSEPYRSMAEDVGVTQSVFVQQLENWLQAGAISRWGVVVRHRELGFAANAMLVHDIPDQAVDRIAAALAEEDAVTLCYRRPRHLPNWPYNLFCMIHGQCRSKVEATIAHLRERHALGDTAHAVLFSQRCFKQTGARYV
ncbi:Lrp/AsnC family transcriptional regulator [Azonexus sp.]|uniref:siroheme decarboxylase subunit beta n=1 Tax=Azonexus sp. TaxID=1872668 RepID=UPI0039E66DDD